MTREEAIAILQEKHDECKSFYDLAAYPEISYPETAKYMLALRVALSALRPVSRVRRRRRRVQGGCPLQFPSEVRDDGIKGGEQQ